MNKIEKTKTHGKDRSPKWEATKKLFSKTHPKICTACGTKKELQLHHVKPFHLHPELELDPSNLMWLCEGEERNCHRMFGHLNNFSSWNEDVREDVAVWNYKIKNRPQ